MPVVKLAMPWMERSDPGVDVPMPTKPELVTTKLVPVVDPIANEGAALLVAFGFIESCAHGVEEAKPEKYPVVYVTVGPINVVVESAVGIVEADAGLPKIPCARTPNDVVLPLEVTTPVRFAFVVTVAALPVILMFTGEEVEIDATVLTPVA